MELLIITDNPQILTSPPHSAQPPLPSSPPANLSQTPLESGSRGTFTIAETGVSNFPTICSQKKSFSTFPKRKEKFFFQKKE
jgi:hypothetical protein